MHALEVSPPLPAPAPLRRLGDQRARAADVLVDLLVAAGVDTVFGLPGGTIAPYFDALLDHPDVRVVVHKHECSAVFAAAAYARLTGKLGVVLVTSGPGILNTFTGLATAKLDGAPVLVLAGEVSRQSFGKGALQEGSSYSLQLAPMAAHVTKLSLEVPEATAAPFLLQRAIATALSGRKGPTLLTLPLDVSRQVIQVPRIAQSVSTRFELDPSALDLAARILEKSRSKILFAGSGVRGGRGPELLRLLAERLQCPVITTPKAKGVFPESHPLSLGVFGMGGHPSAYEHLGRGVEVVLAVGTSLGDLSTNGWSRLLQPSRAFVHVDIDAAQVGRAYPAQLTLTGPAEDFFRHMLERLPLHPERNHFGVRRHSAAEEAQSRTLGTAPPARVIWELQRRLPADTIYCIDSGEHYFFATHYLELDSPDSFMTMTGLGAMSSSLGGAVGASLARRERTVVVICGDGGFAMAAAEVATAAQEELPILFVVMNDQRLGMVELGNLAIYGRTPRYATGPLDIAGLARALGARATVIDAAGQILALPDLVRRPGGPHVLDVRVDPTASLPKNGRFEALGAAGKGEGRA